MAIIVKINVVGKILCLSTRLQCTIDPLLNANTLPPIRNHFSSKITTGVCTRQRLHVRGRPVSLFERCLEHADLPEVTHQQRRTRQRHGDAHRSEDLVCSVGDDEGAGAGGESRLQYRFSHAQFAQHANHVNTAATQYKWTSAHAKYVIIQFRTVLYMYTINAIIMYSYVDRDLI